MSRYIIDKDLVRENLVDIYTELLKINKLGRVDYLMVNALDRLNKHDIHRLKQFDIELEKLSKEFNPDINRNDFNKLIEVSTNLNNIVFDEYIRVLNNIRGDS